ncbi:MAG TPA: cyclic nucleotide-binding domain-containing protein [bacterium]|nr:cyclic nucleotide-binding domain-containing protein [bacterium]HPP88146.1 cyclic nucleotide-binding domain-containing protein [bacterium]
MDIIERLSKLSLFNNLKNDKELLAKIATIMTTEKFMPGKYIIKEGDTGDKMFILNKGTVRVEKKTLAGDKFTVVVLSDYMNIFFGELALMDNDVRSASVVADTDVECYSIKKDDFEKFCEEHPLLGYNITKEIAKLMSARLRKSTVDTIYLIDAFVNEE